MDWSLEKIYSQRVRGSVSQRRHLRVLGEQDGDENTPQEQRQVEHTVDKIKDLIDDIDIDHSDPEQMKKLYERIATFEGYRPIKETLTRKGFHENVLGKFSTEIQSLIENIGREDKLKFFEFLKLGSNVVFPTGERGNVYELIQSLDMAGELAQEIFKHTGQDEKKRGVGMGELALALLFKNIDSAGASTSRELAAAKQGLEELGRGGLRPGTRSFDQSKRDKYDELIAQRDAAKGKGVKGDLELDGQEFEIKGENASLGETSDVVYNRVKKQTADSLEKMGIGVSGENTYIINGHNLNDLKPAAEDDLGRFPDAVAVAYSQSQEKSKFEETFKDFLTVSGGFGNELGSSVYSGIRLDNPNSIQRGIAVLNLLRYSKKEDFQHFMAHDIGADGKGTGQYVYAGGAPEDIATQIKDNMNVRFEKVKYNALRPRIGFSSSKVEDNEMIEKI